MSPQKCMQKYSSERRVIPLNRVCVHEINRKAKPLNGAQVMALMMRFRKGSRGGDEDFQIYGYSPARVVEPDPEDPGANARHTNDMADIDQHIRPVEDSTNKGSFGSAAAACSQLQGSDIATSPEDIDLRSRTAPLARDLDSLCGDGL
jgi:hypothetical protein